VRAARHPLVVLASGLALVAAVVLGLAFGSGSATLADIGHCGTRAHDIVVLFRLPRVLLGVVAGAGLAAVGAAFQTVLRNPLADPYVLGVSGGAALGATGALVGGLDSSAWAGAACVPLAAFAGGLGATALVWALASAGRQGVATVLLAGVAVNAIASSCILVVEALAEPGRIQAVVWWMMGYLDVPSWSRLGVVAAYVAAGLAVLLADAARMNVLALGDDTAASLGIDVRALERRTFFAAAAVVGAIVSVTGPIGFVGLIVPHALRRAAGPDLRALMPACALGGGAILIACDTLVRVASVRLHTEIPVGAVTALVGGTAFLVVLRGGRGIV
jgi:iron complex transport system permease protein